MNNQKSASESLAWLYRVLEPGDNPVLVIGGLLSHLQSQGLTLPGTITTSMLEDPEAFIAQLEMDAEVISNAKLRFWVKWHDENPEGDFEAELQQFIQGGDLPWYLHQYKHDPEALREAIRTLP